MRFQTKNIIIYQNDSVSEKNTEVHYRLSLPDGNVIHSHVIFDTCRILIGLFIEESDEKKKSNDT